MFRLSDNISSFRKHVFPLFFLMAGIIIIYSNALDAGFQLDDQQIINRPNLHVTELSLESLKKTFYWTPHLKKLYRPIPCLTLGLNYYFGGTSPFGYHVVNIAIHLACSFSVYVFLLTLLSIPGIRPRFAATYRYEIAVIAACLFAFHPIQTNVATYVIQRITSMAALFYMCSMTGYIWFRLQTLPGKERSRLKKYLGLTISIASGILAFLSKENTAFLPVMILLADCLLFYGLHHEREKKILRRMYAVFIFLLLGILAYEGPKYLFKFFGWYGSRDFTLMERMLTQPRIIFFYLYLLFVPDVSLLNLGHDIPVSTSFIDPPQTLIAISGIISLVAAAFFLRKKHNLFAFAIVWYLGNLVIESSIIPLELMFEHRTYLPGVLVFFLISFTIVYVSREVLKRKKAILFAALLLILYGNGTYIRNVIFRSTTSLWLDVVDKSPNLPRGHANLGNTYRLHGHFEKAIEELKKAIHLKPDMVEPLLSLGVIYLYHTGKEKEALALIKRAVKVDTQTPRACMELGRAYFKMKDYKKAEHYFRVAFQRVSFYPKAINNLGVVKIHLGKKHEAMNIFRYGISVDPAFENFYLNLAKLYSDEKRFSEGVRVLDRYLSINDNSKRARALLKAIRDKEAKENAAEE